MSKDTKEKGGQMSLYETLNITVSATIEFSSICFNFKYHFNSQLNFRQNNE